MLAQWRMDFALGRAGKPPAWVPSLKIADCGYGPTGAEWGTMHCRWTGVPARRLLKVEPTRRIMRIPNTFARGHHLR
jgi:hypothetical protein